MNEEEMKKPETPGTETAPEQDKPGTTPKSGNIRSDKSKSKNKRKKKSGTVKKGKGKPEAAGAPAAPADAAASAPPSAGPRKPKPEKPTYSRAEMKRLLEAVLFAADKPVPVPELGRILDGAPEDQVRGALADLTAEYESWGRSFILKEVAGGILFHTHPAFEPWVKKLFRGRLTLRLSRSALESLAIIAYRQPIGKQEIETIRGVNADGVLHTMLERRLIKVVGRKEGAGRALLYGTTTEFLQYMGLNDLGDLPQIEEMKAILGAQEGPTLPPEAGPLGPFAMGLPAEASAENAPLPAPVATTTEASIGTEAAEGTDAPAGGNSPAEPATPEPKEYDGGDSKPETGSTAAGDQDGDDSEDDDDEDEEDDEDDDDEDADE